MAHSTLSSVKMVFESVAASTEKGLLTGLRRSLNRELSGKWVSNKSLSDFSLEMVKLPSGSFRRPRSIVFCLVRPLKILADLEGDEISSHMLSSARFLPL